MYHKYANFISSKSYFELEDSPFYWIHKVNSQHILKLDKYLKKSGLDHLRRQILLVVNSNNNLSVSDLSQNLTVKLPTLTKALYKLKDENFISISTCDKDARVTRIHLTPKGENMVNKINELTNVILSNSFDNLTLVDIQKTVHTLKQIFENLS